MSTPTWRKSSYSGGTDNSDCVEAAQLAEGIGLRDSKNPDAGRLTVSAGAFGDLLGRIRAGEFDL
jgi:hypothetical protein